MDKEDKDILLVEGKNSCHRIDLSGSSEDSGRDTIQVDDDSGDEDDLVWALIADDLNSDASTHDIEDRNEEAQEALFEQLIRRTEAMRNPATQTASLQTQFEVSDDDENDFVIDEPYSESLIEDGIQVSDEGRENALKFLQSIVLSFLEQISTSLGTIFSHETSKVHKKELKGLKRRKIYAAEAEQKKRDRPVFRDGENWSDNIAKEQEIWVRFIVCYIHKLIGNSSYQAIMLPDSPLQSPDRQSSIMRMSNCDALQSTLHG